MGTGRFIVGLLAVLVVGAAWWLFENPATSPPPIAVAHAPRQPVQSPVPAVVSAPPAAEAQARRSVSHNLQLALATSTDWRAFALDAIRRPDEGGYFYARYAADHCGRDWRTLKSLGDTLQAKELVETRTLDARALERRERAFADCRSFVAGESSQLVNDAKARRGEGRDPLLAAQDAALTAVFDPAPERVRAAVARLLELDDPLLLSSGNLLFQLARADAESRARQQLVVVFEGRVIDHTEDMAFTKAAMALELGACRPGLPCAPEDELRTVCAAGGSCLTLDEFMRARVASLGWTPADFEEVLVMADKVRRAVARRDVSFFVR